MTERDPRGAAEAEAPAPENAAARADAAEASVDPKIAESQDRAAEIALLLDEHKAEDVVALDMRGISDFTDFFVIATGRSEPHVRALANETLATLKRLGLRPFMPIEDESPRWTIIDYGDVVVHLFDEKLRRHYRLEELWADADLLEWRKRVTA